MTNVKIISVKAFDLSLQIRWSYYGCEYVSMMYSKSDGSWVFDPDTRSINNDGLDNLKAAIIAYLYKANSNPKAPAPCKKEVVVPKNPSYKSQRVSIWIAK